MPPSWNELYNELTSLPADRFEELIAELFGYHFKKPFYLGRKGDQPSGDVYGPQDGVVIQAKRYMTTTSFSENEIVGEIQRAVICVPNFELYILVSTKHLAQLTARLKQVEQDTGIDIIPLTLKVADISDLGALCVFHWEVLPKYIRRLKRWTKWASDRAKETQCRVRLDAFESAFSCTRSRQVVGERCAKVLRNRLSAQKGLDKAVTRTSVAGELKQWWGDSQSIAAIEGQEGMGKSWVAASFAQEFSETPENVVSWLESHLWAGVKTPENVLDICLDDVFSGDESLRRRIKRKIYSRWQFPVLVVLDGANERSAWEAAESIVKSYRVHSDGLHSKIKILFTTRPLEAKSPTYARIWEGYSRIQVNPFSMPELEQAMERLGSKLKANELQPEVRNLACIPRYLSLCVQLYDRLSSLPNITKEVLLWIDLQDKVLKSDPQLKTIHDKIYKTPEEVLSELAQVAGWPSSERVSVSKKRVSDALPNFDTVRGDLIEQRIVLSKSMPGTVALNGSHVVLGWALWLRQLATFEENANGRDLRERILRELEPAPSNDLKAKALHLAALLTFLDSENKAVGKIGAMFLELWIGHHNGYLLEEYLRYFAERDVSAYIIAIEELFTRNLRGSLESPIAIPIARIWKEQSSQYPQLKNVLKRWLTLIYPGGREGSKNKDVQPPHRFPVAESPEQVRLTYVAISIISLRPEEELLDKLVDCYQSEDYCYHDRESGGSVHRIPIKWSFEPLGYLLRWSYSEDAIISYLDNIASSSTISPLNRESIIEFSRLLRLTELPHSLGVAKDPYGGGELAPVSDLEDFKKWLLKGASRRPSAPLGVWAVRSDLPSLSDSEVVELKTEMETRVSDPLQSAYTGTLENKTFKELIPWCAKVAPSTLADVALKILVAQIGRDHFPAVLPTIRLLGLGHSNFAVAIDEIVAQVPVNKSIKELAFVVAPLTALIMLQGNTPQIIRWFHFLEDKRHCRAADSPLVGFGPMPEILFSLATDEVKAYAKQECERLFKIWQMNPDSVQLKALSFWFATHSYIIESTQVTDERAIQLAENPKTPTELAFPLFLMIATSKDIQIVLRGLECPLFVQFRSGYNAWRWGMNLTPRNLYSISTYMATSSFEALTALGWILYYLEAPALEAWGTEVIRSARQALQSSRDTALTCTLIQEISGGRLGSVTHEGLPSGNQSYHSIESATWGIDRDSNEASPNSEQYTMASEAVKSEVRRRHAVPEREIIEFNSYEPFENWSQNHREEFRTFAVDYLKSYLSLCFNRKQELSTFTIHVFVFLLQIAPEEALSNPLNEFLELPIICSISGLPLLTAALWSSRLSQVARIQDIRRNFLQNAKNDEAILRHVIAALYGGSDIETIAFEILTDTHARNRALAVSVLAFSGTVSAKDALASIGASDHSFWVRKHAVWGLEVCTTEIDSRRWYSETLENVTLPEFQCRLVAMEPALSPTSRIWHRNIEEKYILNEWDVRSKLILNLFWRRIEDSSVGTWEVLNRKLVDYCRGEKLKEGITSQQAPWWQPL